MHKKLCMVTVPAWYSKIKKSKKLKFDEENETCLIECTENVISADTNQHKRFKKKKRKKESKH